MDRRGWSDSGIVPQAKPFQYVSAIEAYESSVQGGIMICSGCGKKIPFNGKVCPYCLRDKSSDQTYHVWGMVLGLAGGFIGYEVYGLLGAIIGLVVGVVAAAITCLKSSKPPQVAVAVAPVPQDAGPIATKDSLSDRLKRLQELRDDGSISDEEYQSKRQQHYKKPSRANAASHCQP
jgi:hypothetical protein